QSTFSSCLLHTLLSGLDCRDPPYAVGRFRDIMNPNDASPLGHRQGCQGQAAVKPLWDLTAQCLTNHCLARDTYQHRTTELVQVGHVFKQAQVMLKRLGKAE